MGFLSLVDTKWWVANLRDKAGSSEIVGALLVTFITISFMAIALGIFSEYSKRSTSNLVDTIRRNQRAMMERLTIIDVDFAPGEAKLLIYNYGDVDCTIAEILVAGRRFHLNVTVPRGSVSELPIRFSWTPGQSYTFIVVTSSSKTVSYEAYAQ